MNFSFSAFQVFSVSPRPDIKEVCVKRVYPLRFASEGGQAKYEQFYHQFNDTMHK